MSRVGRMPIEVPASATVTVSDNLVRVKGPKGELEQVVSDRLDVVQEEGRLLVERHSDEPVDRSLHGLTRTLIHNMVRGVTDGFEKVLEIQGVGYKAILKGEALELQLGYSNPRGVEPPAGVEFEVPVPTRVIVRGCDKQKVGQVAADIRRMRKPDPYKGKGIRYRDEYVRRKAGKAIK
ncbi:MAG: 50S ribosomal protein L6 [Actinobacteria bacterium]|nr:50S ribosomal protein L6 [Actinomycetota bacterium]